jgi:hypothetical protein
MSCTCIKLINENAPHHDEDTLDQYLGDIVLKYIKKENPEEQSVWPCLIADVKSAIKPANYK